MQLHFILALLVSFFAIVTAAPRAYSDAVLGVDIMERDAAPVADAPNKGWKREVGMPRGGKGKRDMDSPKGTWKDKRDICDECIDICSAGYHGCLYTLPAFEW